MKILPNGVAVIDGDVCHAVWCATEGLVHDKFMERVIVDLMRETRASVVVDAGANIGTLTRVFLNCGATVHAFEPNPEAMECLKHNCLEAIIHNAGLGDKAQTRRMILLDNAGASFVAPESDQSGVQVCIESLDSFCIYPDIIKLDVEGFEVNALRGAVKTIARNRPHIICEVNAGALLRAGTSEQELWSILRSLNYDVSIIQPDCRFGDPQYDVIARPK